MVKIGEGRMTEVSQRISSGGESHGHGELFLVR